jgi:methionyl-tRNA formyltransferase
MRVIFVGGKDVGCGCLEYLLGHVEVDVVAVFVNPVSDTAAGRWYRSASELALAAGVPVHAPRRINDEKNRALIAAYDPDLLVCVYYDQILRREVLDIPHHGCVNLHLALAEEYRGCYPTTWALLNGETRTGVTLHWMDEGVDSGDIIAQTQVGITPGDTGRSLYEKCTVAGIQLFASTFPRILDRSAPRRPQQTTERTRYYRREFPTQQLDLRAAAPQLYDHLRAVYFPPFPLPHFYVGDRKFVIVEESLLPEELRGEG